jgi:hypothetical protein
MDDVMMFDSLVRLNNGFVSRCCDETKAFDDEDVVRYLQLVRYALSERI